MVDTQKIKGKESKHAHTENHQLTQEKNKRRNELRTATVNKITSIYQSIITLTVNALIFPIK